MNIKTHSKYLAALLPFVSTEETRYYLCGINVRPLPQGGIVMAATDGHILGVIHDPDGSADAEYIIPIDENCPLRTVLEQLFSLTTREYEDEEGDVFVEERLTQCGSSFIVENGEARLYLRNPMLPLKDHPHIATFPLKPIDGTFPDYGSRLFGKNEFGVQGDYFACNADLLMKFSRAAQILGGVPKPYIRLHHGNEPKDDQGFNQGPALVTVPDENFFGLIMPVRATSFGHPAPVIPDWLRKGRSYDNPPPTQEKASEEKAA